MEAPTSMTNPSENFHEKKRWNAFVCQDCRAIFRIPADYDGKGVVCPACDRMLRLPRVGETLPELVQSAAAPIEGEVEELNRQDLHQTTDEEARKTALRSPATGVVGELIVTTSPPEAMASSGEWRRRKKHRIRGKNAENEWQQSESRETRLGRRIPVGWLWGGAALLMVFVLMIAMALIQQDKNPVIDSVSSNAALPPVSEGGEEKNQHEAMLRLSQIKEAHDAVEAFFQARSIEDLMPLLRPASGLEEKIRRYYIVHPLPDNQYDGIEKQSSALLAGGRCIETLIRLKNQSTRQMTLVKNGARYQIDWESWVGWSEMNVVKLRDKKPLTPIEVRVTVESESYYNYDFPSSMESRWQSYKLTFADDEQVLHAYVERSSPLNPLLLPPSDVPSRPMILRIRYRSEDSHSSQVLIDSVVSEGWVKDMPRE